MLLILEELNKRSVTSEELGKTAGKDARQQKATFAGLLGADGALEEARAAARRAVDRLGEARIDSRLLAGIAEFVVSRRS